MGRYFGTDGIRGIAGDELTAELALAVGAAGMTVLGASGKEAVIGMDTRESSAMLASAVAAGAASRGADVLMAGVVPTPAVAMLTAMRGAACGVVISASHNPFEYNGIKFFGPDGFKLPDSVENEIEAVLGGILSGRRLDNPDRFGRVLDFAEGQAAYEDFAVGTCPGGLKGMKVLLDCSNGAAYGVAPEAFRRLGAEVSVTACRPDGRNINLGCGATAPQSMADATARLGFDIGFALDGDADRCIMSDESGRVLDGDFEMAIIAGSMRERGLLGGDAVVATAYSNMGFAEALGAMGLRQLTADNGDRYVLEVMRGNGVNLGGEQSGHIVMLDLCTTGDGLLTAIRLAQTVKESGKKASELASTMRKYPQGQMAVRVARKDALTEDGEIWAAVRAAETELRSSGRVLVRASGTEPVVRVMVEAADKLLLERVLDDLAALIAKRLS